jgi:beta-lactamase superfamily II metal-dependent hydrolase
MRLQIFDVEHGACGLLTADNNTRLMIDCGHNVTTRWKPGTYLKGEGIGVLDMLGITNYEEDHASGSQDLFNNVHVGALWRNESVSSANLRKLKSEYGMGPGITRLCSAMDIYNQAPTPSSPLPVFQSLGQRLSFCNSYPSFDDENNLSMAIFLQCHGVGVMFTGDLEKAGFEELLKNQDFRHALQATRVYVASHHGRESGCSDKVARLLTGVYYVVISDKGYEHETQNTMDFYRAVANGGPFREEQRRVLTTRNDGRIGFEFTLKTWGPY